jgi:hypothetical protein
MKKELNDTTLIITTLKKEKMLIIGRVNKSMQIKSIWQNSVAVKTQLKGPFT